MTTIPQLVASIDRRLEELRTEIAELENGRAELAADGGLRVAKPEPGPKPQGQARRRGRRRRPVGAHGVVSADALRAVLGNSEDGLTTAELAERANGEPAQVLPLVRELELAGQVRRTGQRRGTRWHAVASEEDWIERRAAELAARSRNASQEPAD